jgi:ATP-binding cassette subfamily C protein CydD
MSSESYRRGTMAVLRVAFLSSLVLEFFATVSIAVVAVLIGFRLLWGEQVFSRGMFVLLLAPEFYLPLRGLGALRHTRMDALAIAEEVHALLDKPVPERTSGRLTMETVRAPSLSLRGVDFAYADGRGALHGLSLDLPAGRTTVLVGPSGAGKSTVVQLLLGLLTPQAGQVLVDGVALTQLDLAWWRRQLSWLPQRPHLFVGTLRDNVLLGAPQADDAALQRAAELAGLLPVLARLPQAWDTPLGEHGYGLSGGEAQRVALARALLRDTPVLILDEPAQQLDQDTAAVVQRALAAVAAQGRTVVQVAHRMAQARGAEHIVVIERGRVAQSGSDAQLRAAGGAYAALLAADGVA